MDNCIVTKGLSLHSVPLDGLDPIAMNNPPDEQPRYHHCQAGIRTGLGLEDQTYFSTTKNKSHHS